MNTFGRLLRVTLFGESHGEGVGVVLDGCPAGLALSAEDLAADLDRRRGGKPGTTPRAEADRPRFLAGLHRGRTSGAPLAIWFDNADTDSAAYDALAGRPRPGHADWTAGTKYGGFNDPRGGGMFSGRLTVGLVAAGAVARKLLAGVVIQAEVTEAGGQEDIQAAVAQAEAGGDSVGGLVACRAAGVPAGLGEPWFDALESSLAHLLFAIPGVRGVAFGAGFDAARMRGSECNDPILDAEGRTGSNHAGGVNGGISNGNPIEFQVAFKPTASIGLPQQTIDTDTGEPVELTIGGRHDACIALRAPVVVEAACALVLADAMLLARRLPRVLEAEA